MNSKTYEIELEGEGEDDASQLFSITFLCTSQGSPAHYGSLAYAGHPAEGPEFELESIYDAGGAALGPSHPHYAAALREGERLLEIDAHPWWKERPYRDEDER